MRQSASSSERAAADPGAVAIDGPGLQDVEGLAGGECLLGVDQANFVEPTARSQRIGKGTAERAGSEDGDKGHER